MKIVIAEKLNKTTPVRLFALAITAMVSLYLGQLSTVAQVKSQLRTALVEQDARTGQQSPTQTTGQSAAHKYFTDVVLINQNGEKMRLYSDLLKGKVVIFDFFFATCQGSCLPMNRNLQKIQEALGARVGKDVYIVSITVDPTVDTPASLKEYAKKLNAGPGWYFLSGDKANVEFALRKLGQYVDDKQNHTNIFIIGNERTGLWKKAFGLARSDELIKVVESVIEDQPVSDK
ncbi:MAG TPA: SCO family protein [Pyrinomonadaceae bacterium]